MKVRTKIELAALGTMLLLCAAILIVGYGLLSSHFRPQPEHSVQHKMRVAQLLAGGLKPGSGAGNGAFQGQVFVNQVKDLLDVECTLFQGDVRAATTIANADGTSAIGSRLENAPVIERVLHTGEEYHGPIRVLGQAYTAA